MHYRHLCEFSDFVVIAHLTLVRLRVGEPGVMKESEKLRHAF